MLTLFLSFPNNIFAAKGKIKAKENHQTMEGFGAAVAWYASNLSTHAQKDSIYSYLFKDLGLDMLRLRNQYRYGKVEDTAYTPKIVEAMYALSQERPKILMSSWSPEAGLKSNLSRENGGTLRKWTSGIDSGKYRYGTFAKYWTDALAGYSKYGITADYISIQNEPNFTATWESCRFDPTENSTYAGYNKALDSVYVAIQNTNIRPKIIGPEPIGIGYNNFQNYVQPINKNHIDGYAYHLYHGESDLVSDNHDPDLFNLNLSTIANSYSDKPIFETEYDRGDWFNTVWLIQNCLISGNVSGYFYWGLVWDASGKGLIELTTSSTFKVTKYYWGFRQYSKYISSGWKRVTATNDATGLKMSAFINPDGKKLTVVVVNVGTAVQSMNFDIQDFNVSKGTIVRTSETENGITIDSTYSGTTATEFPARSITTISFSGQIVNGVDREPSVPLSFSLAQNYPNPFNPSTTIRYQLSMNGFTTLKIYDALGREIGTLVNEFKEVGSYDVKFDASKFANGIYFYRLQSGNFSAIKKLVLLK